MQNLLKDKFYRRSRRFKVLLISNIPKFNETSQFFLVIIKESVQEVTHLIPWTHDLTNYVKLVWVCVCVRAYVRACVRACVHACVRVGVGVCMWERQTDRQTETESEWVCMSMKHKYSWSLLSNCILPRILLSLFLFLLFTFLHFLINFHQVNFSSISFILKQW